MKAFTDFSRLSLNQATTQRWSVREAVDGCIRAGIPSIGLWRDKVAATGLAEARRIVRDSGLHVSSLCRTGWLLASTIEEQAQRLADNMQAIEEAAELGTELLTVVCGPAPDRDIRTARCMMEDSIAQLAAYAGQYGVKLGIEPLHPMYAGDRSAIVTLAEANQLAAKFSPQQVGVVIDVYHVWWDPDVYKQIALASGRILSFHISDWLVPTPDILLGRGMMGDGIIELRRLRTAVEEADYTGPIEVEIFNREIWDRPGDEVLHEICERFLTHV